MQDGAFDDTVLMAFADGVLDAASAARVEAALRRDPALAARVAVFAATRDRLSAAALARRDEPVPADLLRRVQGTIAARDASTGAAQVLPFRRRARPITTSASLAVAASLALAVGLGAGFMAGLGRQVPEGSGMELAGLSAPGLPAALDRLPSGESEALTDARLTLIASFTDADGAFCREFELSAAAGDTLVAVACREAEVWQPRFAVAASTAEGYAPASSLDALEAYLSAVGASVALSPDQEALHLERGAR